MTLQQLEYIVALEKYGHFVLAAEACGITQPTLSATIQKLEEELDVQIFDRSKHPVVPTSAGQKILSQAKVILYNSAQLKEITLSEKEAVKGSVRLGIIPTIAPYIVPGLFKIIKKKYSGIELTVTESPTSALVPALKIAELDMAVLATHHNDTDLLEIPLYNERLVAYVSEDEKTLFKEELIDKDTLKGDDLWVLRSEHCLSSQVFNICGIKSDFSSCYAAGSIETLVKIVDTNGGYTIIPELHVGMLSEEQKKRVRYFLDPQPTRGISLYIRKDYVREGLVNAAAKSICSEVPERMVDPRIRNFEIRL